MRGINRLLVFLILLFIFTKATGLLLSGKLFEPGAFKASMRESLKTLWQGMQLFVVVWILYLLLMYWVRHR